jgi:chromosomal replication initiator protein
MTHSIPPTPPLTDAAYANDVWSICLEKLCLDIPENQVNTWLRPVQLEFDSTGQTLTLWIANRFKLDWIRSQYFKKILHTVQLVLARPVDILLAMRLQTDANKTKATPSTATSTSAASAGLAEGDISIYAQNDTKNAAADLEINRNKLNRSLVFDNLIEGSANRMARAAGLHVANMLGDLYNPLFIYGGVGLGKTHLMHAIGNQLMNHKPMAKVLYIHAEQFVSDVVKAYQRKTFDEFKNRYHSLDLLLIDDVQFFANKERTQEEFFNAFEALLARKSHIVMTSDTYPKGLTNIHDRLVSRFDAGLTVALEPPELELRVAILMNKTQAEGLVMPEDVAFFVAKNVRSNVRELEGALRKILAFSKFNQKEISITLARESLKDLLSIQNRQISIESIQKTVADFYKIKVADMYSKRRPASIAGPRQIAMYLAKELTKRSLPEIGDLFGGRDHTTVLHAVRKVTKDRLVNLELNQQLHVLEQTLKN